MNWRWAAWFGGALLLGLIALFPLRFALGPIAERGFTARHVAGTIWDGRIGELMFRERRLGTFEVRVAPLPLMVGAGQVRFSRIGDPDGPLDGTLSYGSSNGVRDLTGRIAAAGLFGAMPIESVEPTDVTLLFREGRCIAASGQLRVTLAIPIPGDFARQLSGTLRCERERVRFRLANPSGVVSLEFYVTAKGRYRAWLRFVDIPPGLSAGLAMFGFNPSPEGLAMSVDGHW